MSTRIRIIIAVVALVMAVVVAVVVFRVTYPSYNMPSGSMLPTISVGDRFFVKRGTDAAPGDVIVFKFPENRKQDFVKRVVATGGQRLEVIGGRPVINGELVPACPIGELDVGKVRGFVMLEKLGRPYLVMFDDEPSKDTCNVDSDCGGARSCRAGVCGLLQGPYEVADGEVWVMGDNRNNSHDSRSWNAGMGAGVPIDDIIGRMKADDVPKLPEPAPKALQEKLKKCLDDL